MASPAWRVTNESCGSLENNGSEDAEGGTGPRVCVVVIVVSTSCGTVVVVWAAVHVMAVGTVVSGAVVEEIVSASSLSASSSGRCCGVAPMLGPAARAVPHGGWVCVAFLSGALVLVGLLVNRVFLIGLLVGE